MIDLKSNVMYHSLNKSKHAVYSLMRVVLGNTILGELGLFGDKSWFVCVSGYQYKTVSWSSRSFVTTGNRSQHL